MSIGGRKRERHRYGVSKRERNKKIEKNKKIESVCVVIQYVDLRIDHITA